MKVGIIGAMEVEVATVRRKLRDASRHEVAGVEVFEGMLEGTPACVVRSGVAKVNAAICAQALIDRFGVEGIVNTGVAGALDPALGVGDLVVSTDCVHHDVDATIWGYEPGEVPGMRRVAYPADPRLRQLAIEAASEAAPDAHVVEGRIASGEAFVSDSATKHRIRERFRAACCEMEGAAIAQASWANGVPFVVIRAISDDADETSKVAYPVFEAKAARRCAAITCRMAGMLGA
jgi:adenosylhomocysteine nucleosidase